MNQSTFALNVATGVFLTTSFVPSPITQVEAAFQSATSSACEASVT